MHEENPVLTHVYHCGAEELLIEEVSVNWGLTLPSFWLTRG